MRHHTGYTFWTRHLKPDEVCWKENEGEGGKTEDVCNVDSKGGRTFHAGLRGNLLFLTNNVNCKAYKRIFGESKKNMPSL